MVWRTLPILTVDVYCTQREEKQSSGKAKLSIPLTQASDTLVKRT
ncbi:hypothetical protein SPLC1_S060170 [Arthrospira platensis C1]|nr:hypothetical protein SPLC1_S060170 [Arthrospira platensis C1]